MKNIGLAANQHTFDIMSKQLGKQGLIIEAFSKHMLLLKRAQEILQKDLSQIESGEIATQSALRPENQMRDS